MEHIIVNEKDEIIGYKNRTDITAQDICRVSALWVYNSKNEILLAQRSFKKSQSPGKWGPAVAGTVEKDETYLSNILKEAQEEIGLKLTEDQLIVGSHKLQVTEHKYFRQYYIAKLDINIEDLKIQESEVEQIKWVHKDELAQWLKTKPEEFTPSLAYSFKEYLSLITN